MEFLRFIWKDMRSFRLTMKIVGLIFGIALIVSVWCLGVAWWTRPVNVAPWYVPPRMRPRLEYYGVIVCVFIIIPYIASLICRYRKNR
jgi:uncharacterized iron-regulated membrane protein